jgi:hypothetical protein
MQVDLIALDGPTPLNSRTVSTRDILFEDPDDENPFLEAIPEPSTSDASNASSSSSFINSSKNKRPPAGATSPGTSTGIFGLGLGMGLGMGFGTGTKTQPPIAKAKASNSSTPETISLRAASSSSSQARAQAEEDEVPFDLVVESSSHPLGEGGGEIEALQSALFAVLWKKLNDSHLTNPGGGATKTVRGWAGGVGDGVIGRMVESLRGSGGHGWRCVAEQGVTSDGSSVPTSIFNLNSLG